MDLCIMPLSDCITLTKQSLAQENECVKGESLAYASPAQIDL